MSSPFTDEFPGKIAPLFMWSSLILFTVNPYMTTMFIIKVNAQFNIFHLDWQEIEHVDGITIYSANTMSCEGYYIIVRHCFGGVYGIQ